VIAAERSQDDETVGVRIHFRLVRAPIYRLDIQPGIVEHECEYDPNVAKNIQEFGIQVTDSVYLVFRSLRHHF
jgi:hypothetical protein